MTTKERILAGEEFQFPEGCFPHYQTGEIDDWFKVEVYEEDTYRKKAGQPEWMRLQRPWGGGDLYTVERLGDKWLKVSAFFLRKKLYKKIALEDIFFKSEFIPQPSKQS